MCQLKGAKISIGFLCTFMLVFFNGCIVESKKTQNTEQIDEPNELFLPGLVSTSMYERDMAITPDGKELIYTLGDPRQNRRVLVSLRKIGDSWGKAKILNISGSHQDIEPFFAKEGKRLYFASNRPLPGHPERNDYNIWYSNRNDDGWEAPVPLDTIVNSKGDEFFPSLSSNGNLYFTATREDGKGREDIYMSEYDKGKYKYPVSLDSVINTAFFEFNAYISPDENVLIFSSFGREDELGGGDLYMSVKDSLGDWSKARNLGSEINSNKLDYCPFIDWSDRKFYFTSERSMKLPVRIKDPEELVEFGMGNLNGLGNIYRVDLDRIGL